MADQLNPKTSLINAHRLVREATCGDKKGTARGTLRHYRHRERSCGWCPDMWVEEATMLVLMLPLLSGFFLLSLRAFFGGAFYGGVFRGVFLVPISVWLSIYAASVVCGAVVSIATQHFQEYWQTARGAANWWVGVLTGLAITDTYLLKDSFTLEVWQWTSADAKNFLIIPVLWGLGFLAFATLLGLLLGYSYAFGVWLTHKIKALAEPSLT